MLSEARARLANTQGKKAKRKARERQLEEARRLAFVQKRREMKAAGIDIKLLPKRGVFNYNREIPFHMKPQSGFFDTSEEQTRVHQLNFRGKLVTEMNLQSRSEKDAERRKKEEKRRKEAKDKGLVQDIPMIEDDTATTKRRKLNLPAPQIGEQELEELVKLGQSGELARAAVEESDHQSSRGLMSDYGKSIQMHIAERAIANQAMRTPMLNDNIQTEAANLLRMQKLQTPLLGGDNVELVEGGTGFEGLTPHRATGGATPAALGSSVAGGFTPRLGGETPRSRFGFGGAPGSVATGGATPLRAGVRDKLHINSFEDDISHFGDDVMEAGDMEKHRLDRARFDLERGLASLPMPKNDFEIVVPEVEEAEDEELTGGAQQMGVGQQVEDAGEADKLRRKRLAAIEEMRRARRSQPLQNGLPRPLGLALLQNYSDHGVELDDVNALIAEELCQLVNREAYEFPPNGFPPSDLVRPTSEDTLDLSELEEARALIQKEMESLKQVMPTDKEWLQESNGVNWLIEKVDEDQYRSVYIKDLSKAAKSKAILADAKANFEVCVWCVILLLTIRHPVDQLGAHECPVVQEQQDAQETASRPRWLHFQIASVEETN